MESYCVPKEEYQDEDDNDNLESIVKKEEDIVPKFEESNSISCYFAPYFDKATVIPWRDSCSSVQLLKAEYNVDMTFIRQKYHGKPFLIIKEPRKENLLAYKYCNPLSQNDEFIQVKIEQEKSDKRQKQNKFCKNYVGLLCSGFARTVLAAKPGHAISNVIQETLKNKKSKYGSLRNQDNSKLLDSFKDHVYKVMCGKKVRKLNRERDFKIRNTKDLQNLWKVLDKNSELMRLKKETLKEILNYFFESDYYDSWLANGMMTPENRNFFLINKDEILRKFLNPGVYKPKFNRDLDKFNTCNCGKN